MSRTLNWKHHVLMITGLLVIAVGIMVGRNWTTFALIYDNMTAMNEGKQVAQQVRYPADLLAYMADHPERVSLVAYDVGAEAEGIAYGAKTPRPMVSVPNLMLLAAYADHAAAGRLDPAQRVPLDALERYALPGAGAARHRQARAQWRHQGLLNADSTVALRHVVQAIAQHGDRAATDWLIARLGRETVDALPARLGMEGTAPPRPTSGTYLSWNHHGATGTVETRLAAYQRMPAATYADRVYQLAGALRTDATFRQAEHNRLAQRGTDLSLRHQRALAQATYPRGTAADYADWMARLARPAAASDSVSAFVRRQLEQTVDGDSVQTTVAAIGSKAGALPGLISFVGYVRRTDDRPPRVMALFMEDTPMALFYHLMQTGLDRGFYLQLLTDETFFQNARTQLAAPSVAVR